MLVVHAGPAAKLKSLHACSILARMRAVISEGVLEKRTALLIQNFMEQVELPHCKVPLHEVGSCCLTGE